MTEKATFAAGCFWGVEDTFMQVEGVTNTQVGYTGGRMEEPTYRDVCGGETGHAEAVTLEFNPEIISYDALLDLFWEMHDPTTPNRQGPDIGSQYRSAIFYHSPEQERAATASKARWQESGRFANSIVTEIVPAVTFYPADEYHQKYNQKHGRHCAID